MIAPDPSWEVIVWLACEHDFITGVNLRKNAGQDNAIMAGLNVATGEVIVIMDDDLQHDPVDIVVLHKHIQCGFDVVYARTLNTRSRHSGRTSGVGLMIDLPC